MLKDQRGSAAMMAVVTMMFLAILAGAASTLVNSDLRFSKMNSDAIEAQFAAEAGAKRAISMFFQTAQSWTWLDQTVGAENWINLANDGSKQYHVRTVLSGIQVVPAAPAAGGTYTITSTGRVNNTTRTVSVVVTVNTGSGGGNPLDSAISLYAGSITGSATVNNGTLQSASSINNVNGSANHVPNTALLFPSYNFATFKAAATKMPAIVSNSNNLSASKYYVDGDWNITAQNVSISANNTIVFVNGNVNFNTNSININGNMMLIVTGNITVNVQNFNFSNGVIISYGNLTVSSLNGFNGSVFIKGSANFQGNCAINYTKTNIQTFNSQMESYLNSGTRSVGIGNWRK